MADRKLKEDFKMDPAEEARLQELYSYEILDTEKDEHFEQIVHLASNFFDVPMAAISLVDENRQWFKAKRGIPVDETPRIHSFCHVAIQKDELLYVPDATRDIRFARNPYVTGEPEIRFYAGAPLVTSNRNCLGTLCVIDRKPRELTADQQEILQMLANQVMDQLELKLLGKALLQKNRELAQAHQELKDTQSLLVQKSKMSSLGEMAGGIAHEINNPLAIIRARAQLMRSMADKGQINPETLMVSVEKIDATTVRIAKIISGLRKFARDAEQDPFQKTSVREMIENASELCASHFKGKEIRFEVNGLEAELEIECRNVQIIQVLVNLFSNSIDAIAEKEEKWIRVDIAESAEKIEIVVKDSGTGIPPEFRDRIMQPFFTTKGVGKGTGLGLSISKGIVESHHGAFELIENSPNTCFRISIPKFQPAS